MKTKIKKVASAISAAVMVFPGVALAQFVPPSGGETGLPTGTIQSILTKGMMWVLMIVGILGVIGFAIAGILYLTAAGDEDRVQSAKRAMLYSIIGVIVALLGLIIMQAVKTWLSGSTATF